MAAEGGRGAAGGRGGGGVFRRIPAATAEDVCCVDGVGAHSPRLIAGDAVVGELDDVRRLEAVEGVPWPMGGKSLTSRSSMLG